MSVESLLLFAQAHIAAGAPNIASLITAEPAHRMRDERVPVPPFSHHGVTHWGLGWFLGEGAHYRMAGHDGGTNGQFAYLRIFPTQRVAFALLMNSLSESMANRIEEELMRRMIGESVLPDPVAEPFDPRIEDYVGRYRRVGAEYRVTCAQDAQLRAWGGISRQAPHSHTTRTRKSPKQSSNRLM